MTIMSTNFLFKNKTEQLQINCVYDCGFDFFFRVSCYHFDLAFFSVVVGVSCFEYSLDEGSAASPWGECYFFVKYSIFSNSILRPCICSSGSHRTWGVEISGIVSEFRFVQRQKNCFRFLLSIRIFRHIYIKINNH